MPSCLLPHECPASAQAEAPAEETVALEEVAQPETVQETMPNPYENSPKDEA